MRPVVLPPSWRKLVLATHIAVSVGALGADLVLLMLLLTGFSGADPLTVYPAARLVGAWLIAPLAVATLVSGVLLGAFTPWGLFRYWWVAIKLAIVLALVTAVFLVLVPGLGAIAEAVAGATPRPLADGERLRLVIGPLTASVLLIVALLLGVFKPGWRLGRAPREVRAGSARQSPGVSAP